MRATRLHPETSRIERSPEEESCRLEHRLAPSASIGFAAAKDALVVEAISKGAARSRQMDNRRKTMIAGEFKFGFAVDWMRRDHRALPSGPRGSNRPMAG
jgi:hypothetical protein